jgi:O-antigen biosynthesis protein
MYEPPVISIVVLSCNQAALTIKCFDSIKKSTTIPYEIVWVDNGSLDSEFNKMCEYAQRDNVRLVKFKKNMGFVGGVNAGIQSVDTRAKYLVLLNNDTEVGPKTFEKLIRPFEANDKVGAVGPLTQSKIAWQEAGNFSRLYPKLKIPGYSRNVISYTVELEKKFPGQVVDTTKHNLSFFCAAFRREVFINELGGLEKEIMVGLGDDDLACHKLRILGYKLFVALDSFVYHHHRTTFKALNLNIGDLRRHNLQVMRNKIKELENKTVLSEYNEKIKN